MGGIPTSYEANKDSRVTFSFFLFTPVALRPLVALTLLSQIKSIYMVRQAEKKLGTEDEDETPEDFWRALWLDPNNNAANAYLSIFRNCPIFHSHQHGARITGNSFTLIGQTSPNEAVQIQINSMLPLLGGLLTTTPETLVNQVVNSDDSGQFQVQVQASSVPPPGTQYTVCARVNSDQEFSELTQLTLIQHD